VAVGEEILPGELAPCQALVIALPPGNSSSTQVKPAPSRNPN